MTDRKTILLLIQSILCIAVAIILCFSVLNLYRDGLIEKEKNPLSPIYTREKTLLVLKPVLPAVLLSVCVSAAAFVLGAKGKDTPVKDTELNLKYLRAHLVKQDRTMFLEQKRQMKYLIFGWTGFFLCMAPVCVYLLTPSNFMNEDLKKEAVNLLLFNLPWVTAGTGILTLFFILTEKSMKTEFKAALACRKDGLRQEAVSSSAFPVTGVRIAVLAAALIFIVLGIFNGSMSAVLAKAIRICTECIGLG
ncbi:MAG: hypothetical protein K5634_01560 [Sphaerochaetaceae bacterium]|nr:hypothetical protein [Sphaerochaetaceae bacterium]